MQEYLPKISDLVAGRFSTTDLKKIDFSKIPPPSPPPFLYLFIQRLLDLMISIVLLGILFPVLLVIGLIIRLDSPGPAIFSHQRIGLGGQPFTLYKFRTMRTQSDPAAISPTQANDPRITKVGKFLRRTSLDELPQLWNIFLNQMTLVGPRPEMPFLVAEYDHIESQRLNTKPGITGLWQICGRQDIPLHQNLEYDLYYLYRRSTAIDLYILWRTIFTVFQGKGAY